MTTINLILGCLMLLTTGIAIYWTFANYRQCKKNILIADDLDLILRSAIETVKNTREAIAKQETLSISDLYSPGGAPTDLSSPVMLSTILTVLVRKYGDVRLTMKDFSIPDEEYVSVYVDTRTKELILSINHSLLADDPYAMAPFTDPDDNTFH